MSILLYIYIIVLRIIYFFLKLFPVKNRVVFVSRQSDKPSLDFVMLASKIQELDNDVEIVFCVKRTLKNVKSVLGGTFVLFKQMYYMATSKVCITDGYNIAISVLRHKKGLKIVQLWHSLGAIKKFGCQCLYTDKDKKIAKIMKMHKGYDYINGCSKEMIRHYSKAFGYDESYLYPFGLPRIDHLIKEKDSMKDKVYLKYPELKDKKIILYIPTFRDDNNYKIEELISSIDLNKYALVVKIHPKMNISFEIKDNLYTCTDFSSFELLPCCDYVITDYSGMMIEASSIDKPIYLYVYDIDDYTKTPGLNVDLEKEFKGFVFKDAKELYKFLDKKSYDYDMLSRFKNKYVSSVRGDITESIAKFILEKGFGSNEKKD